MTAATVATAAFPERARAAEEENIEVYFGCGCFWHVQHELVEVERRTLGRTDMQITARAGYAGARARGKDGRVCYHNAALAPDYGSLGHAEAVRLEIPPSSFPAFARAYLALFDEDGNRPDQRGDKGREYRNLVGLPGGMSSPYAAQLVRIAREDKEKLAIVKGEGGDRTAAGSGRYSGNVPTGRKGEDTDIPALSYVMDTADFPFYVGERYHQFHNGFRLDEIYPRSYNNLAGTLAGKGLLGDSRCPNGIVGVGLLGF